MNAADMSLVLEYLAAKGERPDMAWAFAIAHWKEMQDRYGAHSQSQLLSAIAARFTDDQQAGEILAFAKANLSEAAMSQMETAINEIRGKSRLKTKTLSAVDDWIKARLEANRGSASRNP